MPHYTILNNTTQHTMSKGKLREQLKGYQRMKPLVTIKEYIMIILCTIPYAIAVNWILVPHTIVGGGLTGLCEIIYFATDTFVPIWLSSFVCNLALLIAAFFTVGWRYCVRITRLSWNTKLPFLTSGWYNDISREWTIMRWLVYHILFWETDHSTSISSI